mgnify:CR=1 FL=1
MYSDTTLEEHLFLLSAGEDISNYGKTDKRCPRCGNEIIIEEMGTSYAIRCKTDGCLYTAFRGI